MLEWVETFVKKYGVLGGLVLIALFSVMQTVQLIPWLHELVAAEPKVPTPAQEQFQRHIEQTKGQAELLKDIVKQLKDNHDSQAQATRIVCFNAAKTDGQRSDCLTIK